MKPPAGALQVAGAFGAGLVTGLSHFPDPLSVVIAAVAGALLLRRTPHRVGIGVLMSGVVIGALHRQVITRECAASLPVGEHHLVVHVIDPGLGVGRVRPVAAGCDGVIMARWPSTPLIPAGIEATVSGRWLPRPGWFGRGEGMLRVTRITGIAGSPGWIDRSRTAVVIAARERFGEQAPLVEALVGGWRGRIDPSVRDAFAASGLIHLLSISGFHVALMAGWVTLLMRLLGLPGRGSEVAGAVTALAYAAWLGWPAPATRAAALFLALVLTRWHQRHVRADGLLGASAVVVLAIDPWSIVDLGAWLSFAAIAGVTWACVWSRRAFGQHPLLDPLAASCGATLATAPIAALTIGRVAPIGLLLNFLAIPITAMAMPALLLALVMHDIAPMASEAFAVSASALLDLLQAIASFGAALPGAASESVPGLASAIPWLLALTTAIIATWGRSTRGEAMRRVLWGAVVVVWWPLADGGEGRDASGEGLTLHFLDVGQGDATAIRTPRGYWVLIDAGPSTARWDAGERVIVPFLLRQRARRLELVVISHPHRDHVGGAAAVTTRFPVGVALDTGEPFAEVTYEHWLREVAGRDVRWRVPARGETWQLDGVSFRVLHPPAAWDHRGEDPNEDSLVLEVRFGDFSALLTGDAGFPAESALVTLAGPVDLLKVGHHGSRGSTGELLLQAVRPATAVISVGRNNYGHPAAATLARLQAAGVEVWRTDHQGTVTVVTDGRRYTIRGGRSAATHDAQAAHREAMPCCTSPRSPHSNDSSSTRSARIRMPPAS